MGNKIKHSSLCDRTHVSEKLEIKRTLGITHQFLSATCEVRLKVSAAVFSNQGYTLHLESGSVTEIPLYDFFKLP